MKNQRLQTTKKEEIKESETDVFLKEELNFIQTHRIQKSDIESQITTFVQQLRCIPNISEAKALSVARSFKDMISLCEFIRTSPGEKIVEDLSKIQIFTEKNTYTA